MNTRQKTGGRTKGTPNRSTKETKEMLQKIVNNEIDNLGEMLEKLEPLERVNAIAKLFGEHAFNIQINSTKSMTGHLLGAAGVIEAIAALHAIIHGIVPPTINHFTDDENIDPRLNFTFNTAVEKEVNIAMSNTFGFGGHNACVLFKKI